MFAGMHAAVVALVTRATHRIARHALTDRTLIVIAAASLVTQLLGVHFSVALLGGGPSYLAWQSGRHPFVMAIALTWLGTIAVTDWRAGHTIGMLQSAAATGPPPGAATLLADGLGAGLLTFGGAYTAIPFLQDAAVGPSGWMTSHQFLDGVALCGVLPAPLVILGTFVGWIGGGLLGAIAMTSGIFAPAFGFTLLGHAFLERLL